MNTNLNQSSTLRVNVWDYPSVVCEKCGCEFYEQVFIFKKISGLVLGTGGDDVIQPVPVCICKKCGEVMSEYKKDIATGKPKEATTTSTNTTHSNLII